MKPSHHLPPEHSDGDGSESLPGGLAGIAAVWERFWFRRADPLPLGVIRVLCGLVILYVHLIYSLDLVSMVGPEGWLNKSAIDYWRNDVVFTKSPQDWSLYSEEIMAQGQPVWSVYYHLTDPNWIVATHIGFLLVMFLFTIGFATRLTAVLTWVGVISYINRLPVFLYGMDAMMNIAVVYLMIAPSGATMSVDRLIAKWRARKKGLELGPPEPTVSANFALRLFQVHFCIIYLASGLSKLQGASWWSGSAVWGTMANYSFAPMNWPIYLEFLKFLCQSRFVWEFIMTTGTYFTLALEISFPYLIWRPKLRWFMICLSVMMHTGIGLIMGLTTFSLFMMCMVLAFVPASTHHALVAVVRQRGLKLREALRGSSNQPAPAPQQPVAAGA